MNTNGPIRKYSLEFHGDGGEQLLLCADAEGRLALTVRQADLDFIPGYRTPLARGDVSLDAFAAAVFALQAAIEDDKARVSK